MPAQTRAARPSGAASGPAGIRAIACLISATDSRASSTRISVRAFTSPLSNTGTLNFKWSIRGKGMIAPHIHVNSGSARDVTQNAVIGRSLGRQLSRAFEPVHEHRVIEADFDNFIEVGKDRVELGRKIEVVRDRMANATGHDAAAQKPVSGKALVQPQQPLADTETVRVRHGEARIVADHAEVRHVVVQPLHFQEHNAEILRARWNFHSGESLQGLAVGQRVPDGRVAGDALR